jgi:hypothetical protein
MSWIALVVVMVVVGGCRSDHCQRLQSDYAEVVIAQSAPLSELPEGSPVQIGLQIHEDLLTEVIHKALAGRLTYRANESVPGGRLSAEVKLTRAKVRLGKNCKDCVEIDARLSIKSDIVAGGVRVFRGQGGADVVARVPLVLALEDGISTLAVDLRRVDIRRLHLRGAGGRDLPWNRLLGKAATKLLRAAGSQVTVAQWRPSSLPGTAVTAAASQLRVFPRQRTVWIGFSVLLPPGGPGLEPAATLGRGESVGVSFSGAVLTHLMQGLINSGAVPNRLDENFNPDEEGPYLVTLGRVRPDETGLVTDFTIWHLPADEGTCYAAEVRARTLLNVEESHRKGRAAIRMRMSGGEVVATRGDDTLLNVGLWLRSVFVRDTLEAQSRVLAADTFRFGPLGERTISVKRIDYSADSMEVVGRLE